MKTKSTKNQLRLQTVEYRRLL